ncbi:PREDICTED: DNA-3-methyladenine glycosylase [Gekko japonicus]|uniref:DNA-3-methyladenine glycosylase II n=1 Tax=Gekko japonicus TaxID=146911 RepID=A0ABM1JV91_GEKJA|nr:PREDICTED: DNA-3-methyladenine glycosylase [Gekko japonicus]
MIGWHPKEGEGSISQWQSQPINLPPHDKLPPGPWEEALAPTDPRIHTGVLARRLPDGRELRGRIVETEAYLGGDDTASHSRGGRQTARNAAMFMKPGTLYVYQIYGLYFCMNISSQGEGAAVLLRSLEPLQGLEVMRQLRQSQRKGPARPPKDWQLCNGPAKLCQALAIDKSFDQEDLASAPAMWLEPGLEGPPAAGDALVCSTRVGISGDWAHEPLRFYLRGNKCVSLVDKEAEQALLGQEGPGGGGVGAS